MVLELLIKNFSAMMQWIYNGVNPAAIDEMHKETEDLTPWAKRCREYNRSQKCVHLKGGRYRLGSGFMKDYNVSFHTFIKGDQRIRCLNNCGFEVWNKPEWSFKWQFAERMLRNTTNRSSASEGNPRYVVSIKGRRVDSFPQTPESLKLIKEKYPLWNDVINPHSEDKVRVVFLDKGFDIGDSNPIKGMKKATKLNPEEIGPNGLVAFPDSEDDKNDTIIL